MLTEADYSHWKKKGSITICSAVAPVYSARTVTCLSSFLFQSTNTHRVCRRKLLLQHRTPTLQHHGNIWIFHFPTRHQISVRCPDTRDQVHHTITLYGTVILYNTSVCHITSDGITISPELHGTSIAELDSPKFFLLYNISIVTSDEVQRLEDFTPTDIQRLRDVHTKVGTLQQTFDFDSLLHIHRKTMLHKHSNHWVRIITTSIGAKLILGTIFSLFYFRFYYILQIRPKPNNTTGTSSSPALDTSPANDEPGTESQ